MKRRVIILRGIPGSGKSTLAAKYSGARVYSADNFFINKDGVYVFDPKKLGEAHAACLRGFVSSVQFGGEMYRELAHLGVDTVIVDNTNITCIEMAPYAQLALAYGHHVEVVTIVEDPEVIGTRNVHGVPMPKLVDMHNRLQAESPHIPWRWNPIFR